MKRPWALLLILLGSLIFLTALGLGYLSRPQTTNLAEALPESLVGKNLVQHIDGQDALDEIARLHKQQFDLISGDIGVYGRPTEVIIWIMSASSELLAQKMVEDMEVRIAELESPFRPAGTLEYDRRKIYISDGMGQIHYYFRSGSRVVWISCSQSLAERALQEVLSFYP
jgi:hypothetical protein